MGQQVRAGVLVDVEHDALVAAAAQAAAVIELHVGLRWNARSPCGSGAQLFTNHLREVSLAHGAHSAGVADAGRGAGCAASDSCPAVCARWYANACDDPAAAMNLIVGVAVETCSDRQSCQRTGAQARSACHS